MERLNNLFLIIILGLLMSAVVACDITDDKEWKASRSCEYSLVIEGMEFYYCYNEVETSDITKDCSESGKTIVNDLCDTANTCFVPSDGIHYATYLSSVEILFNESFCTTYFEGATWIDGPVWR